MEHDSKETVVDFLKGGVQEGPRAFYNAAWDKWDNMARYSPAPRIRRDKLISWISKIEPGSLLDVGCGNGEFLVELNQLMPSIKLTGVDISKNVIEANRARFKNMTFNEVDINSDKLNTHFDMVVCMEVLEHCSDYQSTIGRLAGMAEKWLLITVPCGPLFSIDCRVGHVRHFKSEEIVGALAKAGFRVVKLQQWGFPVFNIYKHVINIWPDEMCESFLSEQKYCFNKKILSYITYAAFKLCLPCWGYQMFVMSTR